MPPGCPQLLTHLPWLPRADHRHPPPPPILSPNQTLRISQEKGIPLFGFQGRAPEIMLCYREKCAPSPLAAPWSSLCSGEETWGSTHSEGGLLCPFDVNALNTRVTLHLVA